MKYLNSTQKLLTASKKHWDISCILKASHGPLLILVRQYRAPWDRSIFSHSIFPVILLCNKPEVCVYIYDIVRYLRSATHSSSGRHAFSASVAAMSRSHHSCRSATRPLLINSYLTGSAAGTATGSNLPFRESEGHVASLKVQRRCMGRVPADNACSVATVLACAAVYNAHGTAVTVCGNHRPGRSCT